MNLHLASGYSSLPVLSFSSASLIIFNYCHLGSYLVPTYLMLECIRTYSFISLPPLVITSSLMSLNTIQLGKFMLPDLRDITTIQDLHLDV